MEERNISEDKEFMERLDKAVDMQMSGEGNDNNSFDLIDYVFNAIKDYYIGTEADSSQEPQTSPCFGDKDFGDDFFEMIKQDICIELLYKKMAKPLEEICSEMEDGKPYNLISTLQDKYDPMLFEYPMLSFYVDIYGKLSDETIKTIPNMYRSNHKFHTINDLKSLHDYLRYSSQKYIATKEDYSIIQLVNECYIERAYSFFIKESLYRFYTNRLKKIIEYKIVPYNVSVAINPDGIIRYESKDNIQLNCAALKSLDDTIDESMQDAINVLIDNLIKNNKFRSYPNISYIEVYKLTQYLPDEFYNLFKFAVHHNHKQNVFKKKNGNPEVPIPGYTRYIVKLIDYIATYAICRICSGCQDNFRIFDSIEVRLHTAQPYEHFLEKLKKLKLTSINAKKFSDEEKKFLYCFANTEFSKTLEKSHNTSNFAEYLDKFSSTIDSCCEASVNIDMSVPSNINNYIRVFTKSIALSLNIFLNEIKMSKKHFQHNLIQTIHDVNRYINSYNTYSESMEFAQQCASYEFVITRSYFFKKYMDEKYMISFITNTNYIRNAGLMMATVNKIYSSTLEVITKYAKKYIISLDKEYLKDRSYNLISIVDISEDETSNTEDETKNVDFVPRHIQNLIIYDITTKPRPYSIPFFSKDYNEPTAILGTPLGTPVPETL